nr:putative integron gene cassette protein [uncultured bacterium]
MHPFPLRQELKMPRRLMPICAFVATIACSPGASVAQADPFWLRSWNEAQNSRPLTIASHGRIAPKDERGTPLTVHGRIVGPDGHTPAKDVVVHAYHRDSDGFDFGPNDAALRTWRLQGCVKTDAEGRFEFQTIRPAPDNLGREGSHIHFTVESPDFGRQWAPTLFFADDPLVTERQRRQSIDAGEFGEVRKISIVDGVQRVEVKIRLKEKADF